MSDKTSQSNASQFKPVESPTSGRLAGQLVTESNSTIYESSLVCLGQSMCFLARSGNEKWLGIACPDDQRCSVPERFAGSVSHINLNGQAFKLKRCPADQSNILALTDLLPYLRPTMLGLAKSFGCGDRLGIATPGHIAAGKGKDIKLILAQQSIREMTRSGRSAQQVMDDAAWGVFEAGFTAGFGSDADHLKTTEDIDLCAAAGFLMFTVDPGDHVDDQADNYDLKQLADKYQALRWDQLGISSADCLKRYTGTFDLGQIKLTITEQQVARAAVKYAGAVGHSSAMFEHLLKKKDRGQFELEISVDETANPTSPAEHYYVASELRRLDVQWVSLAPRFVGDFEKGIDYKGDLKAFEADFRVQAAIARQLGPYKLSIHSGSDKFSIYPIAAKIAGELLHVKTAGTSYLEALRVISQVDGPLFREILDFARDRYPTDRATYHVSAELSNVPASADLGDHQLPALLDIDDPREVLHVTFGSVMTSKNSEGNYIFRQRLLDTLHEHEEAYQEVLKRHLGRHMDLLV